MKPYIVQYATNALPYLLRPIVQLCQRHGWLASGVIPWEEAAKIDSQQRQQRYRLATDRDALRDYEEGRITFGQSPDNVVYFQTVLRDYLAHADETSLFETDDLLKKIGRLPASLP